jgi:hypothetical protein
MTDNRYPITDLRKLDIQYPNSKSLSFLFRHLGILDFRYLLCLRRV